MKTQVSSLLFLSFFKNFFLMTIFKMKMYRNLCFLIILAKKKLHLNKKKELTRARMQAVTPVPQEVTKGLSNEMPGARGIFKWRNHSISARRWETKKTIRKWQRKWIQHFDKYVMKKHLYQSSIRNPWQLWKTLESFLYLHLQKENVFIKFNSTVFFQTKSPQLSSTSLMECVSDFHTFVFF